MITVKLVTLVAIGALAATACSASVAEPGPPDPSGEEPAIDWENPDTRILFDEVGWAIAACEGGAPMLCVERDERPVGAVEAATYALDSFPGLDQAASPDVNLQAFADGYFQSLSTDRAQGCGADYAFEPIEPTSFWLGRNSGISFGFVGSMPDGSPSEMNLQYATIVGDQIISIAAIAYDEGGCPGRDDLSGFNSAELSEFRPYLEDVLNASPLPPTGA